MGQALLLTGRPGSGKTTAIQHMLAQVAFPASGFYTQEMRAAGRRVGFQICTLDGDVGVLAHVSLTKGPHISKYGVDVEAIETLAVRSIRQAMDRGELIVVDEIGPMELLSEAFRQVVMQALACPLPVLGSIVWRDRPFTRRVKALPQVRVLKVDPARRDEVVRQGVAFLQGVGKDGSNKGQST